MRAWLADLKRIAPQVVAVQFDQVEGVQERAVITAAVANEVERGNAVVIAGDSFAVDDAGARTQACQRLDDQRETMGEVIAGAAVEPHLRAILAGTDAKAVVLDLVQPLAAGRQLIGFGWKARRDEPGRQGTLKHAKLNTVGQRRLQLHQSKVMTRGPVPAKPACRLRNVSAAAALA